jgi:hypothetical protein
VCWHRSGRQTLERTTWRCSLRRCGRSTAQGRTVHDLGTGAAPPLCMFGLSVHGARTVRDDAESRLLRSRPRSRLPGGTLSGRRDSRVCLGIGKPPKTPLVDVEPKRDKDLR